MVALRCVLCLETEGLLVRMYPKPLRMATLGKLVTHNNYCHEARYRLVKAVDLKCRDYGFDPRPRQLLCWDLEQAIASQLPCSTSSSCTVEECALLSFAC